MQVAIFDEQEHSVDLVAAEKAVRAVLLLEEVRCDEVALYFVSKEAIAGLHQRFFDDPSPTDCITLPIDEIDDGSYRHLGEIFVCPAVAYEYALQHGGVPGRELLLYVIHSLLHLVGYDDIDDTDRAEMRTAEQRHLQHLPEVVL